MRQLKEIAKEILQEKFSNDPKLMASALGLDLMYVRRIVGLAALDGTTQQKTFEFTMKLLPLAIECGLIGARELLPKQTHERKADLAASKAGKTETDSGRKTATGKGRH